MDLEGGTGWELRAEPAQRHHRKGCRLLKHRVHRVRHEGRKSRMELRRCHVVLLRNLLGCRSEKNDFNVSVMHGIGRFEEKGRVMPLSGLNALRPLHFVGDGFNGGSEPSYRERLDHVLGKPGVAAPVQV
jgi:hypothetical protein